MLASHHDGSHKGITERLVNPDRPIVRNKVNQVTILKTMAGQAKNIGRAH